MTRNNLCTLETIPKILVVHDWRHIGHDRNYKGNSREEFQEIYRDAKEELPKRMPEPHGQMVEALDFVDASHGGYWVLAQ